MLLIHLTVFQPLAVLGHYDRLIDSMHSVDRIVYQAEKNPQAEAVKEVLAIPIRVILQHHDEKGEGHDSQEKSDRVQVL